jgi:3-hydroxyisobutyrate dehydrogenase
MATIGFIGLGNMGAPMARNLIKAGHKVRGFDIFKASLEAFAKTGGTAASDLADAVRGVDVVITMLPAGEHVRNVYLGEGRVIDSAPKGALLIDCSTIDVQTARGISAAAAASAGQEVVDAPVSGGTVGAENATLTFMCGGTETGFKRAEPILQAMGKTIVHAGASGNGQAAKICNNMILGISMIAVCEGFVLAEKLGLDAQKLFDISSKSSGQCWSMTSYCPVPGPVPASPANRDYKPGFTGAMMVKDMRLAQEAAHATGVSTPLGAAAQALYALYCGKGGAADDFSGIIRMLAGK